MVKILGNRSGNRKVTVPDLNNLLKSEAINLLTSSKLKYVEISTVTSDALLADKVYEQDVTAGTLVIAGSTITFTYYNYVAPPFFPPYFPPFFPPYFPPYFPPFFPPYFPPFFPPFFPPYFPPFFPPFFPPYFPPFFPPFFPPYFPPFFPPFFPPYFPPYFPPFFPPFFTR